MKRKAYITISLVLIAAVMLSGCHKTPEEEPSLAPIEIMTTAQEQEGSSLLPERKERDIRYLPDEEEVDSTVLEGYELFKFPAARMSFNVPENSTVLLTDNFNAIIRCEDDTTFYLHRYYNNNFPDSANIAKYAPDHIRQLVFIADGKEYIGNVFTGSTKETSFGHRGFEVVSECPHLTMLTRERRAIDINCAVSNTLNSNQAYTVTGLSLTRTPEALVKVTKDIAGSIALYFPSRKSAERALTDKVEISDGVSLLLPAGWTMAKAGPFTAYSDADENSVYKGCTMYVLTDKGYNYCTEALNLPQSLSNAYITLKCGTGLYSTESDILDFTECAVGDTAGYFFEFLDTMYPSNANAKVLIPPEGNKLYSYRYAFNNAKEEPCAVIFSFDALNRDQVYILAEQIMETLTTIK